MGHELELGSISEANLCSAILFFEVVFMLSCVVCHDPVVSPQLTQPLMVHVLVKCFAFHTNFNWLLAHAVYANYGNIASRLVIVFFRLPFLHGDVPLSCDISDIRGNSHPVLVAAVFTRIFVINVSFQCVHPRQAAVLTAPMLIVERICATLFISDYEKRRRRVLRALLLLCVQVPSAVVAVLFISRSPIVYSALFSMSCASFLISIFVSL